MAIPEDLREPFFLQPHLRQPSLSLLHRVAVLHVRKGQELRRREGTHLIAQRLLGDPRFPRSQQRGREGAEILIGEGVALPAPHDVLALAVILGGPLSLVHLPALLGQAGLQPRGGLARSLEAELQGLHDVQLRQGVRGEGSQIGVMGDELHVHEPARRHRLDGEAGKERRRHRGEVVVLRGRSGGDRVAEEAAGPGEAKEKRAPPELNSPPGPETLHHPFRQAHTAKELQLRRVVADLGEIVRQALCRQHPGSPAVDQDLRRGLVQGRGGEIENGGNQESRPRSGGDEPPALAEHEEEKRGASEAPPSVHTPWHVHGRRRGGAAAPGRPFAHRAFRHCHGLPLPLGRPKK